MELNRWMGSIRTPLFAGKWMTPPLATYGGRMLIYPATSAAFPCSTCDGQLCPGCYTADEHDHTAPDDAPPSTAPVVCPIDRFTSLAVGMHAGRTLTVTDRGASAPPNTCASHVLQGGCGGTGTCRMGVWRCWCVLAWVSDRSAAQAMGQLPWLRVLSATARMAIDGQSHYELPGVFHARAAAVVLERAVDESHGGSCFDIDGAAREQTYRSSRLQARWCTLRSAVCCSECTLGCRTFCRSRRCCAAQLARRPPCCRRAARGSARPPLPCLRCWLATGACAPRPASSTCSPCCCASRCTAMHRNELLHQSQGSQPPHVRPRMLLSVACSSRHATCCSASQHVSPIRALCPMRWR